MALDGTEYKMLKHRLSVMFTPDTAAAVGEMYGLEPCDTFTIQKSTSAGYDLLTKLQQRMDIINTKESMISFRDRLSMMGYGNTFTRIINSFYSLTPVLTLEDCTCVHCMHKQRNLLFVPCNHMLMCSECGSDVTQCPVCKCEVLHTTTVGYK